MSSTYSLVPVSEAPASSAVDRLGDLLAGSPTWVGFFIVLLDGLDFERPPSMSAGAVFFEGATKGDARGREILHTLDEVYRDVRDGVAASAVHGGILERFVWHSLGRAFPERLGPCELHEAGVAVSQYRLDAATRSAAPCVGIEAKTSTRALKKHGADREKARDKASWVTAMIRTTDRSIAGIWTTWVPEDRFRQALGNLIGDASASEAVIFGHEQLRQINSRLKAMTRQMARANI